MLITGRRAPRVRTLLLVSSSFVGCNFYRKYLTSDRPHMNLRVYHSNSLISSWAFAVRPAIESLKNSTAPHGSQKRKPAVQLDVTRELNVILLVSMFNNFAWSTPDTHRINVRQFWDQRNLVKKLNNNKIIIMKYTHKIKYKIKYV